MNPWESYESRINAKGRSRREIALKREQQYINRKLPNSISYRQIIVNDNEQNLAVIDTDNMDIKQLRSMPGEDIVHGGMVDWMNSHWLIIERDANNEVYTRAKMRQCNYLLRWVSDDGTIIERWCIVEDGTKLKRTESVRNSLAYWKRYVTTTPLYAGNPLEPRYQNGIANSYKRIWFEKCVDWAISKEASNRETFNDYPVSGSTFKRMEMGSPKLLIVAW